MEPLALSSPVKHAAVVVAHPDDEIIWAGGTILMHPDWQWNVAVLCRKSDNDRAPKFRTVMHDLKAASKIADLDDSPSQPPLSDVKVQQTIASLLPKIHYDLVITHSPYGEYTRHLRHEETSRAVSILWERGRICSKEIWMFAYEDGLGQYLPRPIEGAHKKFTLPEEVWRKKYRIITELYGFTPESFEARTTPKKEAFWCFRSPSQLHQWLS